MKRLFKPLADYVLVQPHEAARQTEAGIILPDTAAEEKPQQGTVIAVGPGRTLESGQVVPMVVEVGDLLLFGAYAGIEMKVGNQKFLVIRQDDCLLREIKEAPEEAPDAEDTGG
jgi:chaperonin GroES